MNMPKKMGIVFMMMGAVLFIAALLLFHYNRQEDAQAGQQAAELLKSVQTVISEPTAEPVSEELDPSREVTASKEPSPEPTATPEPEPPRSTELTVVEIDGYGYIGYISIPALEIELPVMSQWDYSRLKIAPCRQFGSTRTDDLVIAAHNYKTHFGYLSELEGGEEVFFTDMDGEITDYNVSSVETLAPTSVDAVQNSGHDLVLYTCTYGGATRVAVFCDRVEETVH